MFILPVEGVGVYIANAELLRIFLPHPENIFRLAPQVFTTTSNYILLHEFLTSFDISKQINMPFFPQAYLSSEANLLQLLSDFDVPTERKSCGPRHARHQTFTPKFDVTELPEAYELYGELPGLDQNDVSIEFSDAQTIVVKGKTERPSTTTPASSTAHTEPESSKDAETSSQNSHSATVEDEYDETDTPLATPVTKATATNDAAPQQQEQVETPRAKYWVSERKVGEFERSFSFSQRIEQDFVTAVLKNGVLHVVVPKSQKPKKVPVNVY